MYDNVWLPWYLGRIWKCLQTVRLLGTRELGLHLAETGQPLLHAVQHGPY